jgi:hypothetical protein
MGVLDPIVEALTVAADRQGHAASALGTVQTVSAAGATVLKDGEVTPGLKKYKWLTTKPLVNDRVLLQWVGKTYLIVGVLSADMSAAIAALPTKPYVDTLKYFEEVTFPVHTTVAATWKTIIANTRIRLTGTAAYNLVTGVWTCPTSGLYNMTARVSAQKAAATSTRTILDLEPVVSGLTLWFRDERNMGTSVNYSCTLGGDVYMNAGDVAMLNLFCDVGVMTTNANFVNHHNISFRLVSAF